jgi:ketosteroid isomerase-like protein
MVPGEYVAALERMLSALNHGTFDDRTLEALEEVDAEVDIRDYSGFPEADWHHGHEGVARWITNIWKVAGDVSFTTREVIDAGPDRFIGVIEVNATGRLSGVPMGVVTPTLFTVRDGRFIRIEPFEDLQSAVDAAREWGRSTADQA